MRVHFDLGRDKSIQALDYAMGREQTIFLVAQRDLRVEEPGREELFSVGTVARIRQVLRLPGNNIRVLVEGLSRARLVKLESGEGFVLAEAEILVPSGRKPAQNRLEAATRRVRTLFEDYVALQGRVSPEVLLTAGVIENPGYLADYVAQSIPVAYEEKQRVLEEISVLKRLERVTSLLLHEMEILEIEMDIQQ
jgi:ATP-dependent Lon protease